MTQPRVPSWPRKFSDREGRDARRRLLVTVSTLVAVALAVAGCTIPTTKDGGGYGPSNQTARKAEPPPPVDSVAEPRSS